MAEVESRTPALTVSAAGDSERGRREHNEDTVLLRPDLDVYVLADGAGGHNAGNVASALAATTVAHYFEQTQSIAETAPEYDELGLSTAARRLATAVQEANRAVIDIAKTSQRYRGMGTTVVAVFVEPERSLIHVAHVGDSRCYRLRDGHFEQLTRDHTLINDVLALRPDMPQAQLAKLPRNVVTRALGMDRSVRVSIRSWEMAPGDTFLLCSDGLTDSLEDDEIVEAMGQASHPETQVEVLLQLANDRHADDNIAALIIRCQLTPGTTQLPERRKAQVKPMPRGRVPEMAEVDIEVEEARSEPAPSPHSDDDYPEIVLVGDQLTEDSQPEIHIVPAPAARPDFLDALQDFADRKTNPAPPPVADDGEEE